MTAALLALLLSHESSVSSSRLELDRGGIRATFTFSLEDLAGLARLDLNRDGTVDPGEWRRALPSLLAYVGERFRIEHCSPEGEWGQVPPAVATADGRAPVTLVLRYRASRPLDRVAVRCDLFNEHGGNPRHIAELPGGRVIVFDRSRPNADILDAPAPKSVLIPVGVGAVAVSLALVFLRKG